MAERGHEWEAFEEGQAWVTEARQIADGDIETFAAVSGDRNPLHLDEAYASGTPFGGRIAHGLLGLSVASGLLNDFGLTRGTLVAFLGLTWDFRAPIRPGDTVRAHVRVAGKRETKRPDRGLVRLVIELRNQAGAVVQEGEFKLLVRRGGG